MPVKKAHYSYLNKNATIFLFEKGSLRYFQMKYVCTEKVRQQNIFSSLQTEVGYNTDRFLLKLVQKKNQIIKLKI